VKPEAWRWIALTLSAATIAAAGGFIVSIVIAATGAQPFMAPKGWGQATAAGGFLSWLACEGWRRALRREWAILDRVNDELARVRARRLR
jgi:hypothetical protein